MKKTVVIFPILLIGLCSALGIRASSLNALPGAEKIVSESHTHNDSDEITRTIDASKDFRPFPDLVAFRNTSLQKAASPVLGKLSENSYGRPEITRCWLNLDEMWDYRTREFNFNFKIGVDKYKDIAEKHRETWDWEVESPIVFHDFLKAFNDHSDAVMLTIRRYERDILDGKLPITMEDWKMIFKAGLKHYKELFPNIRFVEVCNEYSLKGFIGATDEEYYRFYKLGYEAVNEINEELGLTNDSRILVGGPVVTNSFMKRLDRFFELYSKDQTTEKKLDFVSWHEYSQPIYETAHRELEIRNLLSKYDLPENLPLFISEHDPHHFSEDKMEYHFQNAVGLVKTLYFTSLYSPDIMIMPWVLYHNSKIQTRFMWFEGPNEPDTKENEFKMLPIGCSMKFLTMHKGREILVDNSVVRDNLVLASFETDRLVIEAVNYSMPRNVNLIIDNLQKVFPNLSNGKLRVIKYLIDSKHSNYLADPSYPGGIEKVEDFKINVNKGEITLEHNMLEENGLVLWEILIED